MSDYVIDTNVLIYYLNGDIPPSNTEIDQIFQEHFCVSIITQIEFLGWSEFLDHPETLDTAKKFLNTAQVIPLTQPIAERTIEFRRQTRTDLPDCVIAATATHMESIVVTHNTGDFGGFDIELYDPFKVTE